jgi:hypothetical protein
VVRQKPQIGDRFEVNPFAMGTVYGPTHSWNWFATYR